MSISQSIEGLKRAQAVYKAAQPKAKRGMFALLVRPYSYVSLRDGHRDYEHFVPGIVTGSRDGIAQRVRVLGYPAELQLDRKDWLFCYVDSSGAVSVPAAVVAKLANEHGVANEYDTLEAAQAAIRDAMSRS